MKNKKKPLKISNGIVIGNSAISKDNFLEAFPKINKKRLNKKIKFLNIVCNIYKTAIIFSWSAKDRGFGEVTYYIDDSGKLKIDDERLSFEFLSAIQNEVVKRAKSNKLEIKLSDDAISNFFSFTNKLFYKK